MNRIATMVLKNLHVVPGAFTKLWRYAANPEKYEELKKIWELTAEKNNAILVLKKL